ncbi:MAG: ABC transporter permease [Actinobacteria bacterium]|nr:ABC transporter permease [Actinomycetota bacterium]
MSAGRGTASFASRLPLRAPRSLASGGLLTKLAVGFLVIVFLIVLVAPILPIQDPNHQNLGSSLQGASAGHPLGTDQLGRDSLARLIWGTRTTILSSLLAVVIAVAIGLPTGIVAAYRRGVGDFVLGRMADLLLALPGLVLLLAAQATLAGGVYLSMAIFGVLLAPQLFRVIRSATLATVRAPYVQAGRLSGASHTRIVWRYIVPNVAEQLAVQVSFLFGFALLVETGLSFLGLGVQPPDPSLGTLVAEGTTLMGSNPMTLIVPGTLVTLLIASTNLVGDTLAENLVQTPEAS